MIWFICSLLTVSFISDAVMDYLQFRSPNLSRTSSRSWWNPSISWRNKWKNGNKQEGERFLGSSTVLVGITDAWHLFKGLKWGTSELVIVSILMRGFSVSLVGHQAIDSLLMWGSLKLYRSGTFTVFFHHLLPYLAPKMPKVQTLMKAFFENFMNWFRAAFQAAPSWSTISIGVIALLLVVGFNHFAPEWIPVAIGVMVATWLVGVAFFMRKMFNK